MPRCAVELFGGPVFRCGTLAVSKFETRKTALLLGVLAVEPGKTWNRNAVCEILWPYEDSEIARTRLRQAVAALRRALGDANDFLEADRVDLRLSAEVDSDVSQFERLSKRSRTLSDPSEKAGVLAKAAALIRENFLPGFTEDWAASLRDHYRAARLEAMENAASIFAELGQRTEATDAFAAVLRYDPLREDVARRLMTQYFEAGLAPNALRVFRELSAALQNQIGFDPSQETVDLAESIRRAAPRPTSSLADDLTSGLSESKHTFPSLCEPDTPLFGRGAELAEALQALVEEGARLLTITGIGGIGKTRLSQALAQAIVGIDDRPVWIVGLENFQEGGEVAAAILEGSGFKRIGAEEALDQLCDRLKAVRGVLILDNFEQIVDAGAGVIAEVLKKCPHLQFVVTSRVLLCLAAERELPLRPLPLPEGVSPEDCPSVQLFLERSRAARPGFAYSAAVSQLVERLEGIPLALTLAAARAPVLTADQMLDQIDRRFEFLAAQRRDLPARHRTMAAAIDWSIQSLSEQLRLFFSRLSVFRGGFTLDAAVEVARIEGLDAIDGLQQLRERSLILATEDDLGLRFRMLETIREYGAGLQDEAEAYSNRLRHAEFFAGFAARADEGVRGPEQGVWLRRMDLERPNALAALDWASENQPEVAARILAGFWMFWHIRGLYHEGRDRGQRAIRAYRPDPPTAIYARALNGLGVMYDRCCDFELGRETLLQSVAVSKAVGDPDLLANSLNNLGNLEFACGLYDEAREHQDQALQINRERGYVRGEAMIAANLGNIACAMMDFGAAEQYLLSALAVNQETGNHHWQANNLTSLGIVAIQRGDFVEAAERLSDSLDLKRQVGHPMGIALTLNYIAQLELRRGRIGEASVALAESLEILMSQESPTLVAGGLQVASRVAAALGLIQDAAVLLGSSESIREQFSIPIHLFEQAENSARREELETALGRERFGEALARGARLSSAKALQLALRVTEEA
ncbi:MAG: tetratricopeptide repeat protein [Fimbriimonadaceae bacterium]|nr:tetratricopeptide repeat protein [Fimbriimonadaceae bacterium]